MKSLQVRLSLAVSAVAAVLALLVGLWSFEESFGQARERQDQRLKGIAYLFSRYPPASVRQLRSGPEARYDGGSVAVDPIEPSGSHFFKLAADVPSGYRTVDLNGEPWRVYVRAGGEGRQPMAVGQRAVIRDRVALNAGLWTAVPVLLLAPLLCGINFILVRHLMKPLARLSRDLDHRTDSDLTPLSAGNQPSEVVPMVTAINDLMRRLRRALDAQRRFVANAAHELRSPLSALTIQIENVYRLPLDREVAARLEPLRLGILRARALTEQLLALAQVQVPAPPTAAVCDVENAVRAAIEDLLPVADVRDIQIVVAGLQPTSIVANQVDLVTVVRNLLSNAIQYSDVGAVVEVAVWVSEAALCIQVKDYGRGIPVEERDRVFDPFYRIAGSRGQGTGLGLSIVKTVIERLGASIDLDWSTRTPEKGLKVEIRIPLKSGPRDKPARPLVPQLASKAPLSQA